MSIFRRRIFRDRVEAVRRYYKSPKFALIDLTFGLISLFSNPYRVCRKFLKKKGAREIYAYGETPYTTYEKIVRECGIGPHDTWMEMGAGRGKGCFWLSQFVGCRVIGIEQIPQFVYFARSIRALFRMNSLEFERGSVEKADVSQSTVIYLYGIWPNRAFEKGTRVITISEPLDGYKVLKRFWVRFPWGRTTAFYQEKG